MHHDRSRSGTVRLPVTFSVRFQHQGKPAEGVAVNVSPEGLCLRTAQELKEGQVLLLHLSARGYEDVETEVQIRWVQEMSPMMQPTFPWEAGARIENPSGDYLNLFQRENVRFVDYRDVPRYPHMMRVMLAGPGTWETTFALNIGRRGLFIRTEQDLDLGALVEVRVHVPGLGDAIPIRAEVVHRLSSDHAKEVGAESGIGVRLVTVPAWARDAWQNYVTALEERFEV
jgi:hypothetical protein